MYKDLEFFSFLKDLEPAAAVSERTARCASNGSSDLGSGLDRTQKIALAGSRRRRAALAAARWLCAQTQRRR